MSNSMKRGAFGWEALLWYFGIAISAPAAAIGFDLGVRGLEHVYGKPILSDIVKELFMMGAALLGVITTYSLFERRSKRKRARIDAEKSKHETGQ